MQLASDGEGEPKNLGAHGRPGSTPGESDLPKRSCNLTVWQCSVPWQGDRLARHVNERVAHKVPEKELGFAAYAYRRHSVTQVCLCLDALISSGVSLNLRAQGFRSPGRECTQQGM